MNVSDFSMYFFGNGKSLNFEFSNKKRQIYEIHFLAASPRIGTEFGTDSQKFHR